MTPFIYGTLSIFCLASCLVLVFTGNADTTVFNTLVTITFLSLSGIFSLARHFIIRPDLAYMKKYAYSLIVGGYLLVAALMIIYPDGPPEDSGLISKISVTIVSSVVILLAIIKLLTRWRKLSLGFRITLFIAIIVIVIVALTTWFVSL